MAGISSRYQTKGGAQQLSEGQCSVIAASRYEETTECFPPNHAKMNPLFQGG
ncbi:MAG: hypothetical protein AAF191_11560 [Verrucomicrobiota bacterium]